MTYRRSILLMLFVAAVAMTVVAQRGPRGRGRSMESTATTLPTWGNDREMPKDVFTFVRIKYSTGGRLGGRFGGWGGGRGSYRWHTDALDADMNLGFRLPQMTSLRVYPLMINIVFYAMTH